MPDHHRVERRHNEADMTRRRFLSRSSAAVAGVGGRLLLPASVTTGVTALLTACGSPPEPPTLVPLFSADRVLAAGREQRIPFAIVAPTEGEEITLPTDDEALGVLLEGPAGALEVSVAGHVVNHDHSGEVDPDHQHADLFRYYPLRATLPEVGIYDLSIDFGGPVATMALQAFDPAEVGPPLPGDRFPVVATPTFGRPDGVDRLCTRFEAPCPFHDLSADEVLLEGRPMALLVATPAFCSTAYCGPVLDTMIEVSAGHSDVAFIHAEVFANPDEVGGNIANPDIRPAPIMGDLGLDFEPSLFLVGRDGDLVDRIDNVFDDVELNRRLAVLAT